MLNFARIKEIKLTDVLLRYKIPLRFKGEYAACPCPLPTHKQGDTGKNFSIHLTKNYWRCFSESCNANNGGKRGGDVINFVAVMEGCRERDAAQKLADWYGINQTAPRQEPQTKTPARMEKGSNKQEMQRTISQSEASSDSVKGYMAQIDAWFDELSIRAIDEDDGAYRKRVLSAIKDELIRSYRRGKADRLAA